MKTKSEYYFAYGSNLNAKNWTQRTGIPFHKAFEKCGLAYLPDARLAFTRRTLSGGVLDIVQSKGHVVAGQIYRIKNKAARDALDLKEGVPFCYRRIPYVAFTENGQAISVFTYKAVEQASHVAPSSDYLKTVADGLQSYKMSTKFLNAAAKNKPVPFLIDSFFCYGTLRRGECRYDVMKGLAIVSEKSGTIRGTLYDCGFYPAAVLGDTKTKIIGELIQVQDVSEAVEQLDLIEGFYGFGNQYSLYRRKIVPVQVSGKKTKLAWVYEYNRKIEGLNVIESGDWKRR